MSCFEEDHRIAPSHQVSRKPGLDKQVIDHSRPTSCDTEARVKALDYPPRDPPSFIVESVFR